jgi:hypothetical protein
MLAILTTPFGFLMQSIPSAVLNSQLQTRYSTIPTKTFGINYNPDHFFVCTPRCFFIFSAFPDVKHWIDIGIFVEKTEPSGKPEGFFPRARPAVFSFFQKGSGA